MFQAPADCDGCPEVLDQTLIAVDRRREDGHDVWETLNQTSKEVAAQVGKVFNVLVRSVGVRFAACEKVLLCVRVAQRNMHVTTVSWQILARFGHEAGCDAEFAGDRLDGEPAIVLVELNTRCLYSILEQSSSICHASDLAKLESSLKDTRTTLSMPSFNIASKLLTGVINAVVVVLIVYRPCYTVSEHTLGQGR